MARIRSIHPGLFTDEAFMTASAHARLLIIGIWCEAWDDGVFEWKPLTLKARLFPVDAVSVPDLLAELEGLNFLCRFEHGGRTFGAVRNFRKYQRPKKPNSSGVLPNNLETFVGQAETSSEPVGNQFRTSGEKSPQMEDGGGREGEEKKEKEDTRAGRADRRPRYAFECGVIRLTPSDYEAWEAAYPSINLNAELRGLTEWAGKQGKNWFMAVSGALAKKDREARLAVERIRAEATAKANAPPPDRSRAKLREQFL